MFLKEVGTDGETLAKRGKGWERAISCLEGWGQFTWFQGGRSNGTTGTRLPGTVAEADCHAEYVCGNGTLESPFEECDEPLREGAVCSEAQSESRPDECACDTDCQLVVCGDGVKQAPFEECDPPNGFSCGDDCTFLAATPCHACITANPDFSAFQTELCDTQPACVNLQNCVAAKGCFSPVAGACWCGTTDIDACTTPTFAFPPPDSGLNCVAEYKAAYGNPTSNSDAIERMFVDATNPDGSYLHPGYPAMGIFNAIASGAAPECFEDCL